MTNSAYKPYRNSSSRKELDLREEMNRTLYGADDEIAKGKVGLLRRMRRADNGELLRCPCRNKITDEPDRDFFCRYCVVGTTIIPTDRGVKEIKDIIPGTKVLGSDGNFHLVKNTFSRLYNGNMIKLHITGRANIPLELTEDHKVFVYRNTVKCHQKKSLGKICMPQFCKTASCKTRTANQDGFGFELIEVKAKDILETDYLIMPKIKEMNELKEELEINWNKYRAKNTNCVLPDKLKIDKDLMFLFGWYVAEGSGSAAGRKTRAVVYSLHSEKEKEIAAELIRIFKEKFNIDGKIKFRKDSKSMQVVFDNSLLSRWMHELCGRYSDFKQIPEFVWMSSSELQKVFVDNFMLGDGHRDSQNYETAGIVSKKLAEGLFILANKLGYYPCIRFIPKYEGTDGQFHSDAWSVYWLDSSTREDRGLKKWRKRFSNDDFICSSITKIEKESKICAVYDLTVSDVHNFIADGILVHNCHGHGYFWDEYKIVYYRNDDFFMKSKGKVKDFEGVLFYFEWNADIEPTDFIVELKLDKEGRPVQPVQRLKVYDILKADTFSADNGRVEFWQIQAKDRREWSVWYGVQNRQHNSSS